jgi:hypothetical protein
MPDALQIEKRTVHMVIVRGEDGFDVLTANSFVAYGPVAWAFIGKALRDPTLNAETQWTDLPFSEAEALVDKCERFHALTGAEKRKAAKRKCA